MGSTSAVLDFKVFFFILDFREGFDCVGSRPVLRSRDSGWVIDDLDFKVGFNRLDFRVV